jgi:DNA-binding MarR family transcriptional regulator
MHVSEPRSPQAVETAPCTPAAALLADLGRWAGRQFAAAFKPVGLRQRHLGTLLELRNGPLTQQSLADAVGVDAAQLVGLLNDLESEALVHRRRDPDDRRRHIVDISELGRERLAAADRAMADIDARLMAGLEPAEQAQFIALLRFVATHGGYDEECAGRPEPCDGDPGDGACGSG